MQSSARRRTCEDIPSGRSFRYRIKSRGPKTVPCGTPKVTVIDEEETPSRTTCCVLIVKIFVSSCAVSL